MRSTQATLFILSLVGLNLADDTARSSSVDLCPGYAVQNARTSRGSLTASLILRGVGCNVYGPDLQKLDLAVTYENSEPISVTLAPFSKRLTRLFLANRIHVKITDASSKRYEVPDEVFPRPIIRSPVDDRSADIKFSYTSSPFSFSISRRTTGEVLFDSSAGALVFEPQYLRLKTKLPSQANIYGLGEHSNSFRLNPLNTTRTFWNRDQYGYITHISTFCWDS